MVYYKSCIECEALAQKLSNTDGNDYVVWYEPSKPYLFFYTRDNKDNTMPETWYRKHWVNVHPRFGETLSVIPGEGRY